MPGSFNDELVIRGMVTEAIKNCGKSRQEIADAMTYLLGTQVTKRALDSYTSEAADQNRFPAQYLRAFCHVTGDWSLIHCVVERSGLHMVTATEQKLLDLGRQYLRRKQAEKTILAIEREFEGIQL